MYWRLHGAQHTTPVALMTSDAKGNHGRVQALLEHLGHFGRGASAFRWGNPLLQGMQLALVLSGRT